MDVKKFILRLMYVSVGLAGLMTAIIILVSPGGNTVGKGISTAFLIFVADGIILLSLLAKHEWLKISTWIVAIYSLTMATIYTWLPKGLYDYNYGNNYSSAKAKTRETAETFGWLTFGGYILASALVIAVLFSLLNKVVSDTDKLIRYPYLATLVIGIASGAVLALSASIQEGGLLLRFGFALLFLALTAAIITFISMAVGVSRRNAARKEELKQHYQQNPEAYAQSNYSQQPYGASYPQQGYAPQNHGPDYMPQPYQNVAVPPVPQAPPSVMPAPPAPPVPQYPAQPSYPPFQSGQDHTSNQPPAGPLAPPVQNP